MSKPDDELTGEHHVCIIRLSSARFSFAHSLAAFDTEVVYARIVKSPPL